MHAHLSRAVRKYLVPVFKLNAKHRIWQGLDYSPFQDNYIFLWLGQLTLLKKHPITTGTFRHTISNSANNPPGKCGEMFGLVRFSDLYIAKTGHSYTKDPRKHYISWRSMLCLPNSRI